MAVAGCINAYDCAGCYLTTLQQLQSDNIGVAINYTAPGEYGRRQLDYIKYTDKCGCTCCLTGENELRIVATQGVIKNFTLTNDDTNEVVNVKWNDLFGSNRAYTMVRYKTGSYPTSITDGTLAVKETTQNQYSVSGYNVSGLTDGTTYYFTAFAVSQDGTIIVVQSKSIETNFDRQPSSSVLAYIPMISDLNDHSLSVKTVVNQNAIISNKTGYFNGNSALRIDNFNNYLNSFPFTVAFRMKSEGTPGSSQEWGLVSQKFDSPYRGRNINFQGNYTQIRVEILNGSGHQIYNGQTISSGVRYCIMMICTSSTNYLFVDNVQKATQSMAMNFSPSQLRIGDANWGNSTNTGTNAYKGYLSRIVVDQKEWSATDRTNYYNKTKKYFGL